MGKKILVQYGRHVCELVEKPEFYIEKGKERMMIDFLTKFYDLRTLNENPQEAE